MRSRASSLPLACWRSTERAEPAWNASSRRFCRSSSFSCMLLPVIGHDASSGAGRPPQRRPGRGTPADEWSHERLVGRLVRHEVADAGQLDVAGARDELGDAHPVADRDQRVLGAVDDRRRHRQAPQAVGARPGGDGAGLVEHGEARRRAAGDGGGHLVDALGVRGGEAGPGDRRPPVAEEAPQRHALGRARQQRRRHACRRRRVLRVRRARAEQDEPSDAFAASAAPAPGRSSRPSTARPRSGRRARGRRSAGGRRRPGRRSCTAGARGGTSRCPGCRCGPPGGRARASATTAAGQTSPDAVQPLSMTTAGPLPPSWWWTGGAGRQAMSGRSGAGQRLGADPGVQRRRHGRVAPERHHVDTRRRGPPRRRGGRRERESGALAAAGRPPHRRHERSRRRSLPVVVRGKASTNDTVRGTL